MFTAGYKNCFTCNFLQECLPGLYKSFFILDLDSRSTRSLGQVRRNDRNSFIKTKMAYFWIDRYKDILRSGVPDNLFDETLGYHSFFVVGDNNCIVVWYCFPKVIEHHCEAPSIDPVPVFPVKSHHLLTVSYNPCFNRCRPCILDDAVTHNASFIQNLV